MHEFTKIKIIYSDWMSKAHANIPASSRSIFWLALLSVSQTDGKVGVSLPYPIPVEAKPELFDQTDPALDELERKGFLSRLNRLGKWFVVVGESKVFQLKNRCTDFGNLVSELQK